MRVPAAMCGVIGLKVTHGRVPLTGVYPLVPSLDTVGPIAGNVTDLAAAYLAMAGDDPDDPWSQPEPVDEPAYDVDVARLRVGIVEQWFTPRHSQAVDRGVRHFIAQLGSLGADITELDTPALLENPSAAKSFGPEVMMIHGARLSREPDRYGPETRRRIEDAAQGTADDLAEAIRWRAAANAAISRVFASGIDVVVAPTVGAMHKRIGNDDIDVDGECLFHRPLLSSFTAPINQIGLPAISAPAADTGAPGVSVQLIGARWSEAELLSVAAQLEASGAIGVQTPPVSFAESP